jgi:chemotaxis protein MotA
MTALTLATFLDPVALGIVGGGTAAAAVFRTPAADLWRGIRALGVLGRHVPFDGDRALEQVAALTRIARRHGLRALENQVIADPDIAAAVSAAVDGAEAEEVAALVAHRRQARIERHCAAAEMWAAAAEAAPAMGMVGTLVGLVAMFSAMTDPAAIGSAMAVALLATLYGALLANLVLMPVAARLRRLARAEALERQRIAVPLAALADINRARVRSAVAAA